MVSPRRSCSCKAVAPEYHDEVEKSLAEARQELDAARQRVFEDTYQIGRIIGHGAFAKVQACTHIKSGQEFAVKTVQKSPEDLKQREGGFPVQTELQRLPCSVGLSMLSQLWKSRCAGDVPSPAGCTAQSGFTATSCKQL